MDKYLVEFNLRGHLTGREIYANSENEIYRQIKEDYPEAHSLKITNISEKEKDEKKIREEEEKISRMSPEEKEQYLQSKAKDNFYTAIFIFALIGLSYGISSHNEIITIICALIIGIYIFLFVIGLLTWALILGGILAIMIGGYKAYTYFIPENTNSTKINQLDTNKTKVTDNTSQKNVTTTVQQKKMENNTEKEFISKIQKILSTEWQKTIDTQAGNKAKVVIKINDKGYFDYKIVSLSYNNTFNTKLKNFLISMKNRNFPPYNYGPLFEMQIEFKDISE